MDSSSSYSYADDLVGRGLGTLGGGGSVPLGKWKRLGGTFGEGNSPLLLDLYTNPLNHRWASDPGNKRHQLHNSCSDFSKYITGVSAVVVHPGPGFNSERLYKVTLFWAANYAGDWALALTLGVYPDIHRYGNAGDHTVSALFEEANPKEDILDDEGYYDVSSFRKDHSQS